MIIIQILKMEKSYYKIEPKIFMIVACLLCIWPVDASDYLRTTYPIWMSDVYESGNIDAGTSQAETWGIVQVKSFDMDLDGNTVVGGDVEYPESPYANKKTYQFVRYIPQGNGGDTWRKVLHLDEATHGANFVTELKDLKFQQIDFEQVAVLLQSNDATAGSDFTFLVIFDALDGSVQRQKMISTGSIVPTSIVFSKDKAIRLAYVKANQIIAWKVYLPDAKAKEYLLKNNGFDASGPYSFTDWAIGYDGVSESTFLGGNLIHKDSGKLLTVFMMIKDTFDKLEKFFSYNHGATPSEYYDFKMMAAKSKDTVFGVGRHIITDGSSSSKFALYKYESTCAVGSNFVQMIYERAESTQYEPLHISTTSTNEKVFVLMKSTQVDLKQQIYLISFEIAGQCSSSITSTLKQIIVDNYCKLGDCQFSTGLIMRINDVTTLGYQQSAYYAGYHDQFTSKTGVDSTSSITFPHTESQSQYFINSVEHEQTCFETTGLNWIPAGSATNGPFQYKNTCDDFSSCIWTEVYLISTARPDMQEATISLTATQSLTVADLVYSCLEMRNRPSYQFPNWCSEITNSHYTFVNKDQQKEFDFVSDGTTSFPQAGQSQYDFATFFANHVQSVIEDPSSPQTHTAKQFCLKNFNLDDNAATTLTLDYHLYDYFYSIGDGHATSSEAIPAIANTMSDDFDLEILYQHGEIVITKDNIINIEPNYCLTAVFSSTTVADETQCSTTEFRTPIYVINPTTCTEGTIDISSVNTAVTAIPDLTQTIDTATFDIVITPTGTVGYQQFTFYAKAQITDSTAQSAHWSNLLTFNYGCGSWTTLTEDTTTATAFVTTKTVTGGVANTYNIQGLNLDSCCTATDYVISSSNSGETAVSEITCSTTLCTAWTITTAASPTQSTLTFYVGVKFIASSGGGTETKYSSLVTITVSPDCSSATFASSTIPTTEETQCSATSFDTALFTTSSPSGCAVVYGAYTDNTGTTAVTGITITPGSTNIVISASSYNQYNFYLKALITGSTTSEVYSNQLTFNYGCGSWTTLTEDTTAATAFITTQSITGGATATYTIRGLTLDSCCTATDYVISSSNTAETAMSEVTCSTTLCTSWTITTALSSSSSTITFYVGVKFTASSSGGTETKYSNLVTINVSPDCSSATFASSTIPSIEEIQCSTSSFNTALFTTSNPNGCAVDYGAFNDNTGLTATAGITVTQDSSNIVVTASTFNQYIFYLKAQITGSSSSALYSNLLIFDHGCGSWTYLYEDTSIATAFLTTHTVTGGVVGTYNIQGLSLDSCCTATDYVISSSNTVETAVSEITCATALCTAWTITTVSSSSSSTIPFYVGVKFTASSGSTVTKFSSLVTITVSQGCQTATFSSSTIPANDETQYSMTSFQTPIFTTSSGVCLLTYEISTVNSGSGAVTTPAGISVSEVNSNIVISPSDASTNFQLHQFYLRATISGSTTSAWSNMLKFYHGCGSWTILSENTNGINPFIDSISIQAGSTSMYTIQGLSLSQPTGCLITGYRISSSGSSYVAHSEPALTSISQTSTCTSPCSTWEIATDASSFSASFSFFVEAEFLTGNYLYSSKVAMNVVNNCGTETISLTPSSTNPLVVNKIIQAASTYQLDFMAHLQTDQDICFFYDISMFDDESGTQGASQVTQLADGKINYAFVTNQTTLSIDLSSSFTKSFWLVPKTMGYKTYPLKVDVNVCGDESITISGGDTSINRHIFEGDTTLEFESFSIFQTDVSWCSIQRYEILYPDSSTILAEDTSIGLIKSYNQSGISYNVNSVDSMTFYVKVYSYGGVTKTFSAVVEIKQLEFITVIEAPLVQEELPLLENESQYCLPDDSTVNIGNEIQLFTTVVDGCINVARSSEIDPSFNGIYSIEFTVLKGGQSFSYTLSVEILGTKSDVAEVNKDQLIKQGSSGGASGGQTVVAVGEELEETTEEEIQELEQEAEVQMNDLMETKVLSAWYFVTDPRTNKKTMARTFNGVVTEPIGMKIISISNLGLVTIEFDQEFIKQDIEKIDDRILILTLKPHLDADPSKLGYTWNCTLFNETHMDLQMQFENPSFISYGGTDKLEIKVRDRSYFKRKAYMELISKNYVMERNIYRQMEMTKFTQAYVKQTENIKESADMVLLGSMAFNVLMASSISIIWGLINSLQMILYLPIFQVVFPQNVLHLYGVILPLSSLDVIPPEYSTELLFDISDDLDSPYNDILEQMGYETHNSLLNMGSLFYFMVLNMLLMLVVYLQRVIRPDSDSKFFLDLQKKFMFNGIFLIFFEGYIEILLSSYLNVHHSLSYTISDEFSFVLAIICMVISIVVVPVALLSVILRNKDTLESQKYEEKYGSAYDGLRINSKPALFYNILYLIRRQTLLILALHPFFISMPWLQLILLYFQNYFCSFYLAKCKPFSKKGKNSEELFNEYCIFNCSLLMMLFTDYLPDPESQNIVGWSMVGFTLANIGVNIFLILKSVAKTAYLHAVKYYNRLVHKSKQIFKRIQPVSDESQKQAQLERKRAANMLRILRNNQQAVDKDIFYHRGQQHNSRRDDSNSRSENLPEPEIRMPSHDSEFPDPPIASVPSSLPEPEIVQPSSSLPDPEILPVDSEDLPEPDIEQDLDNVSNHFNIMDRNIYEGMEQQENQALKLRKRLDRSGRRFI